MASFVGVLSKNPTKYFWPVKVLAPAVYTASTNGSNIDRYRNGGYAALTLQLIAGTYTDGTHAFTIQEADDDGTGNPGSWGTVAAADLIAGPGGGAGVFTSITSSGTCVNASLDYIGRKRWVRVISTLSGITSGAAYSITGLLFAPTIYPAA